MGTWSALLRTTLLTACATFAADRLRSSRAEVDSALSPLGALTLLAGHITLAMLAVLAGVTAWGIARAAARVVPRPRWLANVVVVAAVWIGMASWPLLIAGAELASGAWISEQSWAELVRFAPLVGWIAAAPLVAAVAFSPPATRRRRVTIAVALAVTAIVIEIADDRFQPGQYPELHMIAHAVVVVCTLLLARAFLATRTGTSRVLVLLCAAACLASPPLWLSMSSSTRAELLLRSSVIEHWIRHATPHRRQAVLRGQLAELDSNAGRYVPADELELPRGLIDARDMNVVLIVVDTMRADTLPPNRGDEGVPWAQPGDTPFIEDWLSHSYHFTRAYAAATNTGRSTPTLMRSIQSFDDPYDGVPIGPRMQGLGYTASAVVLDFFIAGKQKAAGSLLQGFDDVQVFERAQTGVAVPTALEQIERAGDRPFFAWVHLYPLHEPGFDGRLLSSEDGSRISRYRRSLQWLDGQLKELTDGLARLGIDDRTVVVLAADHGEGLGEHGKWLHGSLIYDEVLHVPMAFAIPGQPGGRIDTLVGNIDLVPTIMDLLGASALPSDRGRSLVPLMLGKDDGGDRPFYAETSRASFSSVVKGFDKLIYDVDSDVFHRYDLSIDPHERVDLYDPAGTVDRELVRELASLKPELFARELDDPEVVALLVDRLAEVDPEAPGAALPFLVRLVAAHPTPELVETAVALAERSDDRGVRLLVLRYLWPHATARLEAMLGKWIAKVGNGKEELAIIAALAAQGQPVFGTRAVVKRMKYLAERGNTKAWEPYLRLISDWARRPRDFAPVLTAMLKRLREKAPNEALLAGLVLDGAATLQIVAGIKGEAAQLEALAVEARTFATHREPRVRASALRALAGLGDRTSIAQIRSSLLDDAEDVRVRRAAVDALAQLEGSAATLDLVAVGDDSRLTASVIVKLAAVGSADALPFLQRLAAEHHNPYTRKDANKAIARINER